MKKSIVIITVIIMFMVTVLPFLNVHKAYAVAGAVASQALKPVVKRAIVPLLEKGGVKLATKTAREKARSKWVGDLVKQYDIEQAENKALYDNLLKALEQSPTPIPDKPGVGQIVVDAALFATGLDIFTDSYQEIKVGIEQQKRIDYITNNIEEGIANGTYASSYGNVGFFQDVSGIYSFGYQGRSTGLTWYPLVTSAITSVTEIEDNIFHFEYFWMDTKGQEFTGSRSYGGTEIGDNPIIPYTEIPSLEHLPSSPPIEVTDPSKLIEEFPEGIVIEVPLNDLGIDIQTYNEPLEPIPEMPALPVIPEEPKYIPNPDFQPELPPSIDNPLYEINPRYDPAYPPLVDPTGDPLFDPVTGQPKDGGEPPAKPPDGTNPFENFLPAAMLLAFVDLLRAMLFYLVRLADWIFSLVTVAQVPIDGAQFLVDIHYKDLTLLNVIQLLITLTFSFVVYLFIQKVT